MNCKYCSNGNCHGACKGVIGDNSPDSGCHTKPKPPSHDNPPCDDHPPPGPSPKLICIEFVSDQTWQNPMSGEYEMIKASLHKPVEMRVSYEKAEAAVSCGMARYCGAAEVKDCIPGDKGADGIPGPKGFVGACGAPGNPGMPGLNGSPGEMGQPGVAGHDGDDGYKGLSGQDATIDCDTVGRTTYLTVYSPDEVPVKQAITSLSTTELLMAMCDCFDAVFHTICPEPTAERCPPYEPPRQKHCPNRSTLNSLHLSNRNFDEVFDDC